MFSKDKQRTLALGNDMLLQCTGPVNGHFRGLRAAEIFYPDFYLKTHHGGVEMAYPLVTAACSPLGPGARRAHSADKARRQVIQVLSRPDADDQDRVALRVGVVEPTASPSTRRSLPPVLDLIRLTRTSSTGPQWYLSTE